MKYMFLIALVTPAFSKAADSMVLEAARQSIAFHVKALASKSEQRAKLKATAQQSKESVRK